jgi:hypothetical protein
MRVWRTENPEHVKDYQRQWSDKNRESVNQKARERWAANPELYRERNRRKTAQRRQELNQQAREWRQKNPVKILMQRYRAPEHEVLRVLASETCEACGSTEQLHFDHDHSTGVLRGRLCRGCNIAVGALRDSPDIVFSLGRYLLKYQAKTVDAYPDWKDGRELKVS